MLRRSFSESVHGGWRNRGFWCWINDQLRPGTTHKRSRLLFRSGLCSQGQPSAAFARMLRVMPIPLSVTRLRSADRSSITTTADITYYRQVSEKGTIQASLYGTHYSASTAGPLGQILRQTYLSGVVGYDQRIGHRLFAGVNVGARKVFQTGPDPKVDFNANIYLRYRLGDLR